MDLEQKKRLKWVRLFEDYGFLPGAIIGITNSNNVGVVRDALGKWQIKNYPRPDHVDFKFGLPVVGET